MPGHTAKERTLSRIGGELKENPPKAVKTTRRKKGKKAAERVRRAILLRKARAEGVHIPQ